MAPEGRPVDPALCEVCEIQELDAEDRAAAIVQGRELVNDRSVNLGNCGAYLLLRKPNLSTKQSLAILACARNNLEDKCSGLDEPATLRVIEE